MRARPISAVIVDDEHLAAAYLEKIVSSFEGVEVAGVFATANDALAGIEGRTVDVAFLDIEMPQISGLDLLERLKELDPDIEVVLVTGYDQYAMKAYEKHALGYLLKPCRREDVEYYITQVRHLRGKRTKRVLSVKTFGRFDVFAGDEVIAFSNAKAKELLALLVDARGGEVSVEMIATTLWEDHPFDESAKALVRRAIADLRSIGRTLGVEDLIAGSRGSVSLNAAHVECDLFRYLEGEDIPYPGSYMEQYSWAEGTAAALSFGSLG